MTSSQNLSVTSHLSELRRRLLICVASIFVGSAIVWIFFEPIFSFFQEPYCAWAESTGSSCTFLITNVLDPFSITLSIAGYGGVILALPVIFYQFARFVTPALYPHEKRVAFPFVIAAIILFILGAVGGYFIMPEAVKILLTFNAQDTWNPNLIALDYVSFFMKMVLAFGLAAELPLILLFLQKIGILSNEFLRKNRRIAVVLIVILGAIITPTGDPFMLLAISLPMYILFELSILIGKRFETQRNFN